MKKYFFTLLAIFPLSAQAALFGFGSIFAPTDFKSFVELLLRILQGVLAILFGLMALGVLYGVMLYMINSDNEKKREEIKGYLIYAILAITVSVGFWGIIMILNTTIFGNGFWGGFVGIPFISPPS